MIKKISAVVTRHNPRTDTQAILSRRPRQSSIALMVNARPASSTFDIQTAGWSAVGEYLLRAEAQRTWADEAGSFTEWVKGQAKLRGCAPTLFWRWKSAAKYYRDRRERLKGSGSRLPKVADAFQYVSAESIELLAKIERAAPASVFDEYELKTLRGEVAKKDLRAIWEAYSPLLDGRTARGRGVAAPRVGVESASRLEAELLLGLQRSKGSWLEPKPKIYEVYTGDEVSNEVRASHFFCDGIVVARADKKSPVAIHGVEFQPTDALSRIKDRTVRWLETTVDFAWAAFPSVVDSDDIAAVPSALGVLAVDLDGNVKVLRPAPRLEREKSSGELLARDLLARSLRWWK